MLAESVHKGVLDNGNFREFFARSGGGGNFRLSKREFPVALYCSVSSILKDLNWAPLKDRRRDIRLAMLFRIVKCNMPVQADDILLPADPRTRHYHSFKFKHIQSVYKHSFFVRTVPEWNSVPEACVNADTIRCHGGMTCFY